MSAPRFIGSFVFHFMEPPCGPRKGSHYYERDFEELSGSFEHDRGYEKNGSFFDDEREFVVEAALETIVNDESFYYRLKDGDYVLVMLAGTMGYSTWTDWESGATECDLEVDTEWHYMRVMDRDERRTHDEVQGLEPDIPLALRTEYDGEFLMPLGRPGLFGSKIFT